VTELLHESDVTESTNVAGIFEKKLMKLLSGEMDYFCKQVISPAMRYAELVRK
jgi:hypothetical protein